MTESPVLEVAVRISKALLWLFTTRVGLQCVAGAFLLYLLARFLKALRDRSLLLTAAGKRPGVINALSVLLQELLSMAAWAAANIPLLLGVAAVLTLVVALSGTVAKLDEFLTLRQKIQEYTLVLKHLEGRHKVARVECVGQADGKTTLAIAYFDQNGKPVPGAKERVEIGGTDIYIDALVVNFAYSGIESGEQRNLAVPYRVFSEKVAQRDGVPLKTASSSGVPYFLERGAHQVYGLDKPVFDARLTELVRLAGDAEAARKAGLVRSLYGNAVHRVVAAGDAFFIWVEQTGGLTIKEESAF